MKRDTAGLRLAATDLSNFLGCQHLTRLDLAVQDGRLQRPAIHRPALEALAERGLRHEAAYLDHLRATGVEVTVIPSPQDVADGLAQTQAAMARGAGAIAQATLRRGSWLGYADVLLRVAAPSRLGNFSYEVHDTKLTQRARAGAVLQLCLYADLLADLQGRLPDAVAIVSPGEAFPALRVRVREVFAYYAWVRRALEEHVAAGADGYPEPVPHCEACQWWARCDARWRADDHPVLVAGISTAQRRELADAGASTLTHIAHLPVPLPFRPAHGSAAALVRVREQARIQLAGRQHGRVLHELILPWEPGRGLARLPPPDRGDLFFDFEGDPFVAGGGLEYLWGVASADGPGLAYAGTWALDRAAERRVLADFLAATSARWQAHPGMHVYHFAPYEPAALRRLVGRLGTGADQLDRMLRGGLFVDLFAVVREGLRASVESYSIKKLEPLFGFRRDAALIDVGPAKGALELALELTVPPAAPDLDPQWCDIVMAYNRDDCHATLRLRDWLEGLRAELCARGEAVPRPTVAPADASEAAQAHDAATAALRARLLDGVPALGARSDGEAARALLADLLDFHRREEKVGHWEWFRLQDLPADDLVAERAALGGLSFEMRTPPSGRSRLPVDRYVFERQDCDFAVGDSVHVHAVVPAERLGQIVGIDLEAGWIDVRKAARAVDVHPQGVLVDARVGFPDARAVLAELGEWVAEHGIDADGPHRAARDLLLRRPPRLAAGSVDDWQGAGADRLCQLPADLAEGVLPVQGPPGAGKTYLGAGIIVDLARRGCRVGICAVSHRVIHGLAAAAVARAAAEGLNLAVAHRGEAGLAATDDGVEMVASPDHALARLAAGEMHVLGGTAWLWARPGAARAVDVLLIDEAGQLSLANALVVAQATKSLVLLGDPCQLEQPQRGAHPDGADVSALEHVLGGARTVAGDRGIFLARSYRMHPAICAPISELFYEGRLMPAPGCERQRVDAPPLGGAGLWAMDVPHVGNAAHAAEEIEAIAGLLAQLLRPGACWTRATGATAPLTAADVLVVAPYNAQVRRLRARLPPGIRAGTVDMFQGAEAAVVVVSMAASTVAEAPRGIAFLLRSNRLNVAISRARAACVLVASPALYGPSCQSPEQMRLANTLCRYRELATLLPVP